MWKKVIVGAVALGLCATVALTPGAAEREEGPKKAKPPKAGAAKAASEEKWAPAVEPKPLSENVKQGLAWLAEH